MKFKKRGYLDGMIWGCRVQRITGEVVGWVGVFAISGLLVYCLVN